MRIIFLNRFYWPDEPATAQLLADLAEGLAARGHDVTVIASHPGRPDVSHTETRRGVRIVRVAGTRWAGTGLAGKAADFATFFASACWRLLFTARRGDTVVSLTDPPLIGVGAWLVAGTRGVRLVHWVQDIYPELAMELGGHRWLRVLRPLRNLAWRRADRCVTLGSGMAAVLAEAGVAAEKICVIPNWAPAGLSPAPAEIANPLRAEWGLAGRFVVAYSGNLGRVHDLDPVLALAEALRDTPSVVFVFIGAGAQRAPLEAETVHRGLPNVVFHPPQPRARLAESLALGDVHLVTLRPGCERYVFPSKLYGAAAVGRPVIFIGPPECEFARIVTERGFGRAFARTDLAALADFVRTLAADRTAGNRLGAAAARFAAATGGADAAVTRWLGVLAPPGLAEAIRPPLNRPTE